MTLTFSQYVVVITTTDGLHMPNKKFSDKQEKRIKQHMQNNQCGRSKAIGALGY